MSLVGFSAKNHPQQVESGGAVDDVDDRWTPQWLFDELNAVHRFTIDLAASPDNAKCARFYTVADNALDRSWRDEIGFLNPPFSKLPQFVSYTRQQVNSGGCQKVVMILPANRTEQPWWHEHIEPFRDRCRSGVTTRFLKRRINFGKPGDPDGKKYKSSVPFGLVIVTFRPEGA